MDLAISQPLIFKCGLQVPNRLVKAAMAEQMADKTGLPTELHEKAYGQWGRGDWGMILTGNVQVDMRYLGAPGDLAVNPNTRAEITTRWKTWADACAQRGTPTIMQINHPGRQSPLGAGTRGFCDKNIAPSPVALDLGPGVMARMASSIVFGTPQEMTQADIDQVIGQFVETSRLAAEAGFSGVELHAAHGYLLAQFLSSKTNHRTDDYGNSPAARTKLIIDIVRAIQAVVPDKFCIGIKLNSVDHQSSKELKECIEQLHLIVDAGVDFLEISGGTFEDPTMMSKTPDLSKGKSSRTIAREAFFLEFAKAIRSELSTIPLMVTGGFRTREGMVAAVEEGHCDMIGIARPAVLHPNLPKEIILNSEVPNDEARLVTRSIPPHWLVKFTGIKSAAPGAESAWYSSQIKAMAAAVL